MAQLCDEVEVGDRDSQLELLHQLAGIQTLQDVVNSRSGVLGKELLQQHSLCAVSPATCSSIQDGDVNIQSPAFAQAKL